MVSRCRESGHHRVRILAGESDAEIGRKLGILAETVDWYEGLFFCVRDRLGCSSWIRKTIRDMGGEMPLYGKDTLTEQQRHTAYRLFGYYGGPCILDATVHSLSPRPRKAEDCNAWIDDALRTKIKQVAMMETGRINKSNVHLLFRAHLDFLKNVKVDGPSWKSVEKNVAALIESLRPLAGLSAGNAGVALDAKRSRGRRKVP